MCLARVSPDAARSCAPTPHRDQKTGAAPSAPLHPRGDQDGGQAGTKLDDGFGSISSSKSISAWRLPNVIDTRS